MMKRTARERREQLKTEHWSQVTCWTGTDEKGWFRCPRTLPLVLKLLADKKVTGKFDAGSVYLELLSRHMDSGVIEMAAEGEHSYAAGYGGARGVRTWRERMILLETIGFIKTMPGGNVRFKHVLLVHPAIAVNELHKAGKIPAEWWSYYRTRQIETKETKHEDLVQTVVPAANVLPIKPSLKKPSKPQAKSG